MNKARKLLSALSFCFLASATLSVAAQNLNGKLFVPVVEFMQFFGKTVTVE